MKRIVLLSMALIALVSCREENDGLPEITETGNVPVRFTYTVSGEEWLTRFTTTANGGYFDAGDQVGIYMIPHQVSGAPGLDQAYTDAANVPYRTDAANNLEPAGQEPIMYPWGNEKVNFVSYYPYQSAITGYKIPVDVENVTDMGLLVYDGRGVAKQKGDAAAFAYASQLSKLIIVVKPEDGYEEVDLTDDPRLTVKGLPTKAEYDLYHSAMEIPADKTDAGTDVDVTLSPVVVNKDSVRWEALVLPHTPSQAATAGRFFAFTLGGKTYEYKMANETFEKGTKYRYDFMLSGPPKITPQPPTTAPDGMTNCYMVAPGGTVTFRVSRAYTFEDDEFTNTLRVDNVDIYPHEFTPVVLWEDADVIIDEKLAVSGKGKNAKLTVETNSSPGNAVVAIKVGNTIVWSYHIWVTEYAPDGTNTFTANSGYVFMNRNLGATHYNLEDGVKTFGLLYQWGRKDPFPGSISGAAGWSTGGIDSGFEGLGSGGTTLTGNNDTGIKTSIKNPQCFYIYNPANYNWLPDIDNNLWNQATTNQKTIYDPCPSGWRVPAFLANTLDADHSPWKGYASLSGTDTWGKWPSGTLTGGMIFGHTTADRNQNAQHPAAGGRAYSIGTGADWGYRGFYWTGTHTSTYTTVIMFFKWDGEINLVEVSPRAAGFSVRCVQE